MALLLVVLSVFFGRLQRCLPNGLLTLYLHTALLSWTYFVNVLTQSSNSDISSALKNNHSFFMRMEEGRRLWNIEIEFSY